MSSNAHRRVRPCARLAESSNAMSRSRAAPDSSSARADTYTARALPSDVGVEDHDAHCGARPDVPRMPAVGRRGQPPVVGLRVPHRRHPRHAGVVGCAEHHVLVRLDDASRHVAVVVMSCPSPPGRVGGSTEAQLIADYPQQQWVAACVRITWIVSMPIGPPGRQTVASRRQARPGPRGGADLVDEARAQKLPADVRSAMIEISPPSARSRASPTRRPACHRAAGWDAEVAGISSGIGSNGAFES
jgi:hypothetical protein